MAIETLTPFSTRDIVNIVLKKHYDFRLPNYLDVDDLVQEAELELHRYQDKYDPAKSDYGAWHWTLVSRSTLTQLIRSNTKKRNAFLTTNLDELKQFDDEEQDDILETIGGTVDFVYPRFPGEQERLWRQTEKWLKKIFTMKNDHKRINIALQLCRGDIGVYENKQKVKQRDNILQKIRKTTNGRTQEQVLEGILK